MNIPNSQVQALTRLGWIGRCGAFLSLSLPYAIMASLGPVEASVPALLVCLGAAFAAYWVCCVEGRLELTGREILVLGLFLRICLVPMPVCDDMYRYLWEGKILAMGFNPFRLAPDSPALAHFREPTWALINHPHIPTIYPIFAEGLFALFARVSDSAWFFKTGFIAFDLAGYLVLRRILRNSEDTYGSDTGRIEAAYFLNPLLILEIAGRGHFESIPIFFNLAFLWSLQAGKPSGPINLIFGALSKVNSVALLPLLFLRLAWRKALAWSVAIGALIAIGITATGMLENLGKFATDFRFNDAIPFLLRISLPFLTAQGLRILGGILLLASGLHLMRRLRHAPPASQALGFMGLLLLFSPTLHPWYLLWILPFAALTLSRPWLLLTGTISAAYVVTGRAFETGVWRDIPWLRLPEFLPPLVLWLILEIQSRRMRA